MMYRLLVILSLIISLIFGKKIIAMLHRLQVGETVRDLGLEGQIQKSGTPTMGGILILGATNAPWHLDTAFRRPGRFDRIIFVPPPDDVAKESILEIKLKEKPVKDIDYKKIAKALPDYSGADIEALIDITIETKLQSAFKTGIPEPISNKDLIEASKKHKASTKEWFQTAKNFALFANESGLYDPILNFLKIKK